MLPASGTTQPPAQMSGPGAGGARRSPGPELRLPPPLGSRAPCTLRLDGSAMAGGPRLPCSFQCLVWSRSGFLPSTLGLPTREARFSTLLPPRSKSRSQLHPQHLQNSSGRPSSAPATSAGTRVSALPACPRDRSFRPGRPHACIVACPTAKTPGHTRRRRGEGPGEPAQGAKRGRPGGAWG